jgi:hypothetical protein
MGVKVTNNAFGTISAGINNSDTTVALDSGQGARFPSLGSGDFFFATLIDTSNNLEIVKVTARSSDSMTVVRAQDNTSARAFAIGDRFELRPTAALFNELISPSNLTLSGDLSVDTNVLKVDSSNNKVGINTTSPSNDLHISSTNPVIRLQDTSTNAYAQIFTNDAGSVRLRADAGNSQGSSDFILEIDGTQQLSVDASGHLLKPNTPGFSCAIGTGHNSGSGNTNLTANPVNWGNIFQNFGSHLSGTTFTVPVTGRYFVTFGGIAGQNNTGSAARMQMRVNGNVVAIQARGEEGHAYSQMVASYIIQLTANDACTMQISNRGMWQGGSNNTGTNDPHWSMYLLG